MQISNQENNCRHLIRRAAFRAASSPSTSFISSQRSINTSSAFALRSKVQSGIAPSVFRRFASDDHSSNSGVESSDSEHGSVRKAIDSATESVSSYASDAAESLTSNAEQARDSIADAASGAAAAAGIAYRPREDRRESRPYQGSRERKPYDSSRPARGDFGDRSRPDRVLTPNPAVYVGNLLFDVTAADLQREFEEFGPVKNVSVAADARGVSKGQVLYC